MSLKKLGSSNDTEEVIDVSKDDIPVLLAGESIFRAPKKRILSFDATVWYEELYRPESLMQ